MAKTRDLNEALDKYKGNGGNEFFSLDNDKDSAVVRFLIGDELVVDQDWFIVHEIEYQGKKRWIQCSEESDCKHCIKLGKKPSLKLFAQCVDKRDGKTKTWERGQTFVSKFQGLINKYGPLCNRPYEIERHGKKGDQQTKYEMYPLDKDDKQLSELPEKQNLLGDFILLYNALDEEPSSRRGEERPRTETRTERSGSDIF